MVLTLTMIMVHCSEGECGVDSDDDNGTLYCEGECGVDSDHDDDNGTLQ